MKFGVVNKSTTVTRFVLHTLQRNTMRLAVITRKTNIKLGILKGGNWKRARFFHKNLSHKRIDTNLKKKFVFFQEYGRNIVVYLNSNRLFLFIFFAFCLCPIVNVRKIPPDIIPQD